VTDWPTWIPIVLAIIAGWCALVAAHRFLVIPWLRSRLDADPGLALTWFGTRILVRVVHRLRVSGREHVPRNPRPGPLIVVSNHTGSVDPLLIQATCPFVIRWLMARETMVPAFDWLWYGLDLVIPVERDGRDTAAVRRALRILRDRGVVGIFPEGRIVLPRGELWPFVGGVGMLVRRSRASVLLTWVHGTPESPDMATSVLSRSRSRLEILGLYEFGRDFDEDASPEAISDLLRARLAEASGWRVVDEPKARKATDEPDAPIDRSESG